MQRDGLFPEEIVAGSESRGHSLGRRQRRLDSDLQAIFARQLASLLSAGLPVDEVLSILREAGEGSVIDQVAARIRSHVLEGAPLSEALARGGSGYEPYVISAVRAGETSRDLPAVFETIATHLETRRTDRAALATALIYPAFVAAVSLLVCGILMVTVAPQLAAMFEATGRPLPPLTRFMLAATGWIGANAIWLIAGLAAMLIGIPILLRRADVRDRWRTFLLRLPVVGRLMTLEAASQYLRTLALVIGSRQPVVEGVKSATDVLGIGKFRKESLAVTRAIEEGASLSTALTETSFVPRIAAQLVEAGEKSARVAIMTERAAVLVETWLINDRKRLAALIDPILMMVIGGFVLTIVLSVLLPIFDMQSAIQL
ncbi:type II secretion system F family protein [Sulfitobacter sp. D35]|uniref:type II secretion system F family protein n=1 Tax=Sulfitobacter sp. D35 TaxID=3083252 RepID=UPI00296FB922|nr:type II secretion system F family protein [Sulfitobacter sp. D35]MDW4500494.1 type II secretion system F family protein [Sulfitobacter sp. D35]